MTSDKQIGANRLNAQKSTGPKTVNGKSRSRRNALRHGLTAETIIDVIENAANYEAFEAGIKVDYETQTAVEHALVVRLASLLWRLRRATALESGLLQIQASILHERSTHNCAPGESTTEESRVFYSLLPSLIEQTAIEVGSNQKNGNAGLLPNETLNAAHSAKLVLARSFLQVTNLDGCVFDQLGRYEKSLWRQASQIIILLNSFRRKADNLCRRRSRRTGAVRHRRRSFFPGHFPERS